MQIEYVSFEELTRVLGIYDFIQFISSPSIQDALLPVKIIFIAFTIFFACAVVYFMYVSSWLRFHFIEDATEFFSWQAYGLKQITDRWKKINRRLESDIESEYKLAVIEGDDFLAEALEGKGVEGVSFEEAIKAAGRVMLPNQEEILWAHKVRNSIVYEADFRLSREDAKKALSIFETAVKSVGL